MKVVQVNKCQFLQKVPSLWHKQIFVYIDEEFAINGIQPKFLSLLLTGKFRRGVTERDFLKRIFIKGEYTVIQRLCIAILLFAKILSEYDQEIPQLQTADNPVAPRGRVAQPSRDTRKTN